MSLLYQYCVPLFALLLGLMSLYVIFFWNVQKTRISDAWAFAFGSFYLLFFCYIFSLFRPPFAYLPFILLLALFLRSVFRNKPATPLKKLSSRIVLYGSNIIYLIFIISFIDFLGSEYGNTPNEGVNLKSPLRNGDYLVFKGGVSPELNHHKPAKDQEWALDIGMPHGFQELKGFIDRDPTLFSVFGKNVHAPCDGKIVTVVDRFKDLPVGEMDGKNGFGNHIGIDCIDSKGKPFQVRLAHLKSGSTRVTLGQRVRTGTLLAQVGNSGNTSFPHLHIDANFTENSPAKAAPIQFERNFYRAFDVIHD